MGGLQVREQMLEATFTTRRFWNGPQATHEMSNVVDRNTQSPAAICFPCFALFVTCYRYLSASQNSSTCTEQSQQVASIQCNLEPQCNH